MLPTTARKAGPYSCNGSVVAFDFAFKVYTSDDIRVVRTTTAGVESDLVLTTNYTVALNADQDNDPGGTVTTVSTYADGKITVVGDTDYGQPTEITNRGGFYPDVIMKMVDRAVIMAQQLKEGLDRAVKVDVSSTTDPADLLDDITDSVAAAAVSQSAAASSASAASASATAASGSATAASASAVAAAASAASVNITTPSGNAIVLRSTGATDVTLPTSGTLARTADKLSAFAATTSAELAGVLSDETGSGAAVFANTPTLVTPNIGAATGTSLALTGGVSTGSGTVSLPAVAVGETDCGVYRIGTNNLGVAVNGAKVLDIATTGLGITGSVTPTGLVDISGASAGQISFPAAQNPSAGANVLDDYEEASWTPVPTNLTVVGSPTYAGRVTKVGNLVGIHMTVYSSTSTASTAGSTTWAGAPYTFATEGGCIAAVNVGSIASYGVGLLNGGTATIYSPTWPAVAGVVLSGTHRTA